jgi:cobalt-zinc-cadmium efflux system membrane fusion protein
LLAVVACSGSDEQEAAAPIGPVVTVAEAVVQPIRDAVTVAGQVVPAAGTDWTIYAPETALIAELPKTQGDAVEPGELLVRFEVAAVAQALVERQAAVSEASARADAARAEFSRLTSLFERGIIPRNNLDAARAELSAAEGVQAAAEVYLEEARMLREAARITARFSGVVADVWRVAGEVVTAASTDPIMRVIDPARLEIQIEVPTGQALRIRESHPAQVLTLAAGTFTALVTRPPIGLLTDAATTPVRLAAPELSALALNDIVQVELVLDERSDALVVPAEAVQRDVASTYVMVAGPDGIARHRPVRIGLTAGGLVQIADGLQPGELVIVQGLLDAVDGMPVVVGR